MVDGPAGGGDYDIDAPIERLQLADDRLAAIDRQHPHAEVPPVAVERFGDLHRQLPGGDQDQRDGVTAAPGVG